MIMKIHHNVEWRLQREEMEMTKSWYLFVSTLDNASELLYEVQFLIMSAIYGIIKMC